MIQNLFFAFLVFLSFDLFAQNDIGNNYSVKTVVIDAGHGGKDPGALGKNVQEKDIALSVALKTGEYIKKFLPEVEVIYTRTDDTFLTLKERADIANTNNADLFISVHANSISNSHSTCGTETYVLGENRTQKNLEVAKKENSVVLLEDDYKNNYYGFDPNDPTSHIILSMFQNAHKEESVAFATSLQDQFENRVHRKNRGVKEAGFVVLYMTTMPSVLIEIGFLSNESEANYLSSEQGQSYISSAIYRAFKEYKLRIEANAKIKKPVNN